MGYYGLTSFIFIIHCAFIIWGHWGILVKISFVLTLSMTEKGENF